MVFPLAIVHPPGVFLSFVISFYVLGFMRNMANNAERFNQTQENLSFAFGILEKSKSLILFVDA